ncbi:MAG: hypothetical protein KDB68_16425 [Planctomycetes bacterium]|nr:hypothetical protein [Planctomycetota bacterium]
MTCVGCRRPLSASSGASWARALVPMINNRLSAATTFRMPGSPV